MNGLSEKAKGKQRAVDPLDTDHAITQDSSSSTPSSRKLIIRFTDGNPDVSLSVEKNETVKQVKGKIREQRTDVAKRRLRLIHSGRIISDNLIVFDYLDSQSFGRTKDGTTGREVSSSRMDDSTITWLHCSVGAEIEDGEEEEGKAQKTQIKPLRGFDRLAAAGFSEEDIANFRRTFHSQSSGDYLDSDLPEDDEDFEEHARDLEERWIDTLDGGNPSITSSSSSSNTILQGVLIGFFFPLLPFFFLRERRPAIFWEDGTIQDRVSSNVIFSRRMQIALVLGFVLNITFGSWRYLLGGG